MAKRTVKIGISARLYHPQPESVGLLGKTLQYLEQSVAHWVMSRDVLVFMVPSIVQDSPMQRSNMRLADYVGALDGLVLQGGTDLSPLSYGEEPLKPEFGTVEVRICDTPLEVDTAAALAAFVQALAFWLLVERPYPAKRVEEGLYLVYGYNRFQATRFGFDATLVDPRSQQSLVLRVDLLATLERLQPYADVLASRAPLAALAAMAQAGNGSAWLRARHEESGALEDVVRLSARRWAGGE